MYAVKKWGIGDVELSLARGHGSGCRSFCLTLLFVAALNMLNVALSTLTIGEGGRQMF